jgi:hypothetical protein
MSYSNIFPQPVQTQTPAPVQTAPEFIKPENAFYLHAYKVMSDTSIRNYLIQVTKSGNLTAYCYDENGTPEINRGLPLIIKRSLVNSIPQTLGRLGLNEAFEKLDSKEFRKRELAYLERVQLPALSELLKMDLRGQSNLLELVDSMRKVSSRNAAIFANFVKSHIRDSQK